MGRIMKLSDYVAEKVIELGITDVFMLTGGGAMHLNHSIGSNKKLNCIFNHHEQASSIAAEAYYRLTNKLPLVNVTSGPGGTNAITGVYGAYVDSIGMVVLSGQVKYETTVRSTGLSLRQYGDQELDIQYLVEPITKYCAMVTDPNSIRYHLEKAFFLAKTGRPGPCWLDIPLDVQAAPIDIDSLYGFDSSEIEQTWKINKYDDKYKIILDKIFMAKRPVIFAGSGIRLSGMHKKFIELVEKLNIPVVTAWNAHDVIWNNHKNYVGRPGTIGDRSGNFAVQNSDLLIILGSRLNIRQVSYNWESFARKAYKIWVDIDELELQKPSVRPDMPINADLAEFIPNLLNQEYSYPEDIHTEWLSWCKERQLKYPTVSANYKNASKINPYHFMKDLFSELQEDQIIVTGNGSACVVGFQAANIKKGQRLWTNSGCATMGYDLPAAIGACVASKGKSIVCITGDGSIMMNLQELQTIVGNNYPIKIFILNNSGYVSIFQTHRNFFGTEIGGGPNSGVTFPNFKSISEGFNLPYFYIDNQSNMIENIINTLNVDGPAVCEISIDEKQVFEPKLSSKQLEDGRIVSPPLEDLSPFLSKEELASNMIIDDER